LSAAHNEWNHVGIALAAMEEGFFADEGLADVELITFEESAGELLEREAAQVDLLARGIVDIAIDPRTTFVLEARDSKNPVCIVAARRKNHAFVLMGEKGIKTVHELRGKTIRMEHRGGATDVMMRQLLKDHGIEPDEDVPFSYSGGPMHDPAGLAQAFGEGRYGPAYLAIEGHVKGLVQAGCSVLADLRKLYPSRHDRVTAANETFCNEHPEIVKGFLKAMIRGCRFVLDLSHEQRFTEIITEAGFLTSEREKRSFSGLFSEWQGRVSLDLSLPRDGIQLIVEEQKRDGKISGGFQVDDVLRLGMLEQAQLELKAD
jgi:ABC-type nitrate/sulfonate/bicarbonate transport system substrate-binding protein